MPWWEKDPARIFLSCVLLFGNFPLLSQKSLRRRSTVFLSVSQLYSFKLVLQCAELYLIGGSTVFLSTPFLVFEPSSSPVIISEESLYFYTIFFGFFHFMKCKPLSFPKCTFDGNQGLLFRLQTGVNCISPF